MAMGKKAFIAAVTASLVLISIISMQAVRVALANPVPYPSTPNTDLLILHIDSPENYSATYANNTLSLVFRVVEPPSWNFYKDQLGLFYEPIVGDFSVWVYLDGNLTFSRQNQGAYNQLVYDYNVIFADLTLEQYTVKVDVCARAFYTTDANYSRSYYKTNMSETALFKLYPDSKTILFSTTPVSVVRDPYPFPSAIPSPSSNPSPTPTPSPTLTPTESAALTPSLSPTNSPTPQPTTEPTQTPDRPKIVDFAPLLIPGTIIFLAIIVVGLLVYFKKRREQDEKKTN